MSPMSAILELYDVIRNQTANVTDPTSLRIQQFIGNVVVPATIRFDRAFFKIVNRVFQFMIDFKIPSNDSVAFIMNFVMFLIYLLPTTPSYRLQAAREFLIRDKHFETPWEVVDRHGTYDVVIVGGGISGCILANRLSRMHKVLLVHGPGGVVNSLDRVPLYSVLNLGDKRHDYIYESDELDPELRWKGHRFTYNSGKDLGGSLNHAAHVHSYGKTGDYKRWEAELGSRFSPRNMRKFAALHEMKTDIIQNTSYYGAAGEMVLTYPDRPESFKAIQERFVVSAANLTNTSMLTDHNGDQLGFAQIIHASEPKTGFMSSPTRAFLEPFLKWNSYGHAELNNPNLHILLRTMVTKIEFSNETGTLKATGVYIDKWTEEGKGSPIRSFISAKRIVIAGGAIKTPQLLMLSGIGPAETLQKMGIPLVLHHPSVGENLHDHINIGTAMICFEPGAKEYVDLSLSSLVQFFNNGSGFIRNTMALSSLGFFNSKYPDLTRCPNRNEADTCQPDFGLMFHHSAVNYQAASMVLTSAGITESDLVKYFYMSNRKCPSKNDPGAAGLADESTTINRTGNDHSPYSDCELFDQRQCNLLTPSLLHAETRGKLNMTAVKSIYHKPTLNFNVFKSKRDIKMLGELFLKIREIGDSFSDLGGAFTDVVFDDCKNFDSKSQAYGECMVTKFVRTACHVGGTCRIGDKNKNTTVVDKDTFLVVGIDNVYIADGSVVPEPVSGHMHATIGAFSEIAADIIPEHIYRDAASD